MAEFTPDSRVYVSGHRGLVGSAIVRRLAAEGFKHVITRSRSELDLRDAASVRAFFTAERPDFVFLAAAKVGGIAANERYPADFLYDNLMIAANLIHSSHEHGVTKLLNLGSSCIYPKHASQPLQEASLLTGPLEPTNRAYAIAKIAAIELCDSYRQQHGADFVSAMPTNLYGPNDNYDLESSHVLPALLRKFHEAKRDDAESVTVWGTGAPRREFLYVDDAADACLFLMRYVSEPGPVNVGTGEDVTIAELARLVAEVTGFQGDLVFDTSRPDGTPRKLMDVSKLRSLGWRAGTSLSSGLERTYRAYLAGEVSYRPNQHG